MRRWLVRDKSSQPSSTTPAATSSSDAAPAASVAKGDEYQKRLKQQGEIEGSALRRGGGAGLEGDEYFEPPGVGIEDKILENAELLESFQTSEISKFLFRSQELQAEELVWDHRQEHLHLGRRYGMVYDLQTTVETPDSALCQLVLFK